MYTDTNFFFFSVPFKLVYIMSLCLAFSTIFMQLSAATSQPQQKSDSVSSETAITSTVKNTTKTAMLSNAVVISVCKEDVMKSEILWCLKTVYLIVHTNLVKNVVNCLSECFRIVF